MIGPTVRWNQGQLGSCTELEIQHVYPYAAAEKPQIFFYVSSTIVRCHVTLLIRTRDN